MDVSANKVLAGIHLNNLEAEKAYATGFARWFFFRNNVFFIGTRLNGINNLRLFFFIDVPIDLYLLSKQFF